MVVHCAQFRASCGLYAARTLGRSTRTLICCETDQLDDQRVRSGDLFGSDFSEKVK